MRLLARVPPHVNDEHVLGFERFFVAGTFLPAADEAFLVGVDVVVVDVLDQIVLGGEIFVAVLPVAVGFDEITRFVLHGIAGSVVAVVIHRLDGATFFGSGRHVRRHVLAARLFFHFGAHFGDLFRRVDVDCTGHGVGRVLFAHFVLKREIEEDNVSRWIIGRVEMQ